MASGDLLLDGDGNELLDALGDINLKGSTDVCEPCCTACSQCVDMQRCADGLPFCMCIDGMDPAPSVGDVYIFNSPAQPYAGNDCAVVTSEPHDCGECDVIVGPLMPLAASGCDDALCNPCPPICDCLSLTFSGLAGVGGFSCVIPNGKTFRMPRRPDILSCDPDYEFPCATEIVPGGYLAFPIPTCIGTLFYSVFSNVIGHGCNVFDGGTILLSVGTSTHDCTKATVNIRYDSGGTAQGAVGGSFGLILFLAEQEFPLDPSGANTFVVDNTTVFPTYFAGREIIGAVGGTCTITTSCTSPDKFCYFLYEARCTDAGWSVSLINTICSPSDLGYDWTFAGTRTAFKLVKGGACDGSGDCTPGDAPDPPPDSCGPACWYTFKAVCSGGRWVVSFVSKQCSGLDLSSPWTFAEGVTPATQYTTVKGENCTPVGEACPDPTDHPPAPTDSADCNPYCTYTWQSLYDCINAVWGPVTLVATHCGFDTEQDWAVDDTVIPARANKFVKGAPCPGGMCSGAVTPPAPPETTPACPHCYFLYYAEQNCPGDGSWTVVFAGSACSQDGITVGCLTSTTSAETGDWTLCDDGSGRVWRVLKGDLCNGSCPTPPTPPDPPEDSSCEASSGDGMGGF